MPQLTKLALKYGTDKCPPMQSFTPFYEELCKGLEIKSLLEIGIGYPGTMQHMPNYKIGASLFMWRDFFPKAQIYACDIRRDTLINEDRIKSFYCDQSKRRSLLKLKEKIGQVDIIVDDGSHKTEHQILSAKVLLPMAKKYYIIEDVKEPGPCGLPPALLEPFNLGAVKYMLFFCRGLAASLFFLIHLDFSVENSSSV